MSSVPMELFLSDEVQTLLDDFAALLDVRVKSEEDLALLSNAPVLGAIPDLVLNIKDEHGYNRYDTKAQNNPVGKAGSKEGEV